MSNAVPEEGDGSNILKEALLIKVATENIGSIPDDLPDQARFLVSSIRAAMKKSPQCSLCVFVHSNAALSEGRPQGFVRVLHMQDGVGDIEGHIVLTNRDVHNGARRALGSVTIDAAMDELESLGLTDRWTVIWDGQHNAATFYPEGTGDDATHSRHVIHASTDTLTQDEVCEALNKAYDNNLKNPSAHTAKIWVGGKPITTVEDEIERHLKGQLTLFFLGKERNIIIFPQTNTNAGRCDLIFLQRSPGGLGPHMIGVLELKVLRGPATADWSTTEQGLSQGYHYRTEIQLPFATLALYDIGNPPSDDVTPLLDGQNPTYVAAVRARRFPIYHTPEAWRDAGGYRAS